MGETAAAVADAVRHSFPYKRVSSRREREKMDGGKKRTRSTAHALTHPLRLQLEHARHTCEGRILGIELGM